MYIELCLLPVGTRSPLRASLADVLTVRDKQRKGTRTIDNLAGKTYFSI